MTQNTSGRTSDTRPDSLAAAVRMVKDRAADRSDVVVDMKEADRARLDILVQALYPVINDIPDDDERFDFALSSGLQPRLWIDATAHVVMGRDRRLYRFVRDTRLGRVVLCESHDVADVADAVTTYVAERMVEREQAFAGDDIVYRQVGAPLAEGDERAYRALTEAGREVEGEAASAKMAQPDDAAAPAPVAAQVAGQARPRSGFWNAMGWILVGLVVGGGGLLLLLENGVF